MSKVDLTDAALTWKQPSLEAIVGYLFVFFFMNYASKTEWITLPDFQFSLKRTLYKSDEIKCNNDCNKKINSSENDTFLLRLGDHNFCRNPHGAEETVWCYTTSASTRWELCQVPACPMLDHPGNYFT